MPDAKVIASLSTILERLHTTYPNARYELNWETPEQLLVATILAAQCTDERVNQVTATLFVKYPDPSAFANAPPDELEEHLKPTGFYRQKAATIQTVCADLVARHNGRVPASMSDLVQLPGIARKTANVVLNTAFEIPSGVIVDTHVARVSRRLGLTDQKRPEKIELDLMHQVPEEEWIFFGPALVLLGRYTCTHHNPRCDDCILKDLCPRRGMGDETDSPDESEEETPDMTAKKPTRKPTKPVKAAPAKASPTKVAATPTPVPAPPKAIPQMIPVRSGPTHLETLLPADWRQALSEEIARPSFRALDAFLSGDRAQSAIYPTEADLFAAFRLTPVRKVRVVLVGTEPHSSEAVADGLAFSIREEVELSETQRTIHKELRRDLGCHLPVTGSLEGWARQGVMLLNRILTVRSGRPASHKDKGWETFTDGVLKALSNTATPIVFVFWGDLSSKTQALIDEARHVVLQTEHPGLIPDEFIGSSIFSRINEALEMNSRLGISWQLRYA